MTDQDYLFDEPIDDPGDQDADAGAKSRPKRPRKPKAAASEEPTLTFEEALARLEALVAAMESGKLSLEESMARFEEGAKLATQCTQSLQSYEKRVEVLLKKSEADEGEWQPLAGS